MAISFGIYPTFSDKPKWIISILNSIYGYYPLVNIQKAIENGPIEIVDFPIKKW